MSKTLLSELTDVLDEVVMNTPVSNKSQLKSMQMVKFKPGTSNAGNMGTVLNIPTDRDTVDIRLASSTQMEVPVTDLLM